MLLVAIILSILIKYVRTDCDLDNVSPNVEYHEKLYEHLRCNKVDSEPPENSTTVKVKFIIKTSYFDRNEELINIYSWGLFGWVDRRVTWNPDDYDGIGTLNIHSLVIWTPLDNLQHVQEINDFGEVFTESSHCDIKNDGKILCIYHVTHTTNCNSTLSNWPYDIKTCTLRFKLKEGKKDNVIFTFNHQPGIMIYNGKELTQADWKIIGSETGEDPTGDTKLYIKFVVQRQARGIVAMIIVPSIAVAILVLSSIILDVGNSNRFGLAVFSLLINFYLLKGIGELIPHHGFESPSILYFLRGSIFITVCVICLIYILSSLRRRRDKPGQWIINFNDFILNNYIVKVIYKWQALSQTSSDEQKESEKWTDFTGIINKLFFFFTLSAYLIFFLVYFPRPTSRK